MLKPGGIAVFADVVSPGEPLLDTWLQTIEVLRDTSHVRDYSVAEWLRQVSEAGLFVDRHARQRLRLEFASWITRMRTPDVFRDAILALQNAVGEEVREYFEITEDGSFSTDVLVLWATILFLLFTGHASAALVGLCIQLFVFLPIGMLAMRRLGGGGIIWLSLPLEWLFLLLDPCIYLSTLIIKPQRWK